MQKIKKAIHEWVKKNKGEVCFVGSFCEFDKKGERRGVKTEFTSEKTKGEKNPKWKGDSVGYYMIYDKQK